jgi:hypothetical protein
MCIPMALLLEERRNQRRGLRGARVASVIRELARSIAYDAEANSTLVIAAEAKNMKSPARRRRRIPVEPSRREEEEKTCYEGGVCEAS